MDSEIKKEFEGKYRKLNNIENAIEKSASDSILTTIAAVGVSVVMVGISIWLDRGIWNFTGNFLVIYGCVIVIMMYFRQRLFTTKRAKYWLAVSAILLLAALQYINYIVTHGTY